MGLVSILLVCYEDIEAVHDIDQGDSLILLPFLYCFDTLCHDDEIILLAFEVDLDLFGVGACHDESGVLELGSGVVVGYLDGYCRQCGFLLKKFEVAEQKEFSSYKSELFNGKMVCERCGRREGFEVDLELFRKLWATMT
jgi:hypothetical protein